MLLILRSHHRHAQAAALDGDRARQVVARELGLELRQGLGRDRVQLRLCREGIVVRIRQRLAQRAQVDQTQLDEVGPQAGAVDELRLQGLIELRLGDESLADEKRSELFGHGGAILVRLPPGSAARLPSGRASAHTRPSVHGHT